MAHFERKRKGQASMEFLVLFAAFLAFLGIWFGVIAKTGEGVQAGVESAQVEASAAKLAGAMDSACLMGEGNVRIVEMQLSGKAQLEVHGSRLFLVGEGGNAVRKELKCDAGEALFQLEGGQKVEVRRSGGVTQLAPLPIN